LERDNLGSRKKLNVIWAEDFVKPASKWLQENKDKQNFLYLHLLQPHTPYNPPIPFEEIFSEDYKGPLRGRSPLVPSSFDPSKLTTDDLEYIQAKYDANLKYADFFLAKIIEELKRLEMYENSIIVITSDHGEAMLEHGVFGHSQNLFEEEIRIPLIIRFPEKYEWGGRKIDALVQSIDLMPTFLNIYDQNNKRRKLEGKSLLPLITGERAEVNQFTISSLGKPFVEEETRSDALTDKKYKIIITKADKQFFDLEADPAEKKNIFYEKPVLARYYEKTLLKIKNKLMAQDDLALKGKFILDKKTRKHLKALGYIK
jgi:arylsulfatase A-like enzyme